MTTPSIIFSGNVLVIGGRECRLDFPIIQAVPAGQTAVVLYNPDAYTERFGQFRNLVAVNAQGSIVWTAELPTTSSGDRYYKIASADPLIVYSIWSVQCVIDPETGKIVTQTFTK